MARRSFVAEGLDGVEAGGFPGRVEAEDNADGAGDGDGGDDGREREERGPVQEMGDGHGRAAANEDAHDGAPLATGRESGS